MNSSLTLTGDEVAQLLQLHPSTFRQKVGDLISQNGFPPRLPGLQLFSRPAVQRWIETNGQDFQPAALADVSTLQATAALEQRYGGKADVGPR